MCRKDLLVKNLKKKRRQLEKEGLFKDATQYDFFPVSFTLPREYAMFVEVSNVKWCRSVAKTSGSAAGRAA